MSPLFSLFCLDHQSRDRFRPPRCTRRWRPTRKCPTARPTRRPHSTWSSVAPVLMRWWAEVLFWGEKMGKRALGSTFLYLKNPEVLVFEKLQSPQNLMLHHFPLQTYQKLLRHVRHPPLFGHLRSPGTWTNMVAWLMPSWKSHLVHVSWRQKRIHGPPRIHSIPWHYINDMHVYIYTHIYTYMQICMSKLHISQAWHGAFTVHSSRFFAKGASSQLRNTKARRLSSRVRYRVEVWEPLKGDNLVVCLG